MHCVETNAWGGSMKRRGAVVAAVVAAGCLTASAVVPANAADEPRRFLSGWLPYWSTQTSTQSFLTNSDLFSDISPFWHDARWDGSKIYIHNHLTPATQASALAQLRGQGVKILPSITDGSGKGRMATTLASPAKRTAHVEEIVQLVLANGYDGIDLDYETFAFTDGQASWAATRPNWVAFVDELADALHAQGKLLAVTVPPMYDDDYDSSSGYWVYDYAAVGAHVDLLRIMAYDYSVGSPGPIAPLSWVQKVAAFAPTQLPGGKVQLGVPVYGRNWYTGKTGKCPVGQEIKDSNYAMTGANALASLASDGVTPGQITRDAASGEMTVKYSIVYKGLDSKGEKTECSVNRTAFFADATSVADRVKAARAAGLAGAALWTIGGESADQWPAVREAVGVQKAKPGARKGGDVQIGAPKYVTRGQTGSFTAKVTVDGEPSAGGKATLQVNPVGRAGWRDVASKKVPKAGQVVFSHAPKKSGAYRVKVSASGNRKAARSAVLRTRVRAAVSVNSSIVAFTGQKVRLSGTVSPARKGVKVMRQRLVDGRWVTFGQTRTGRDGSYRFKVIPTVKNGSYTYRVVSAPFEGYAKGVSSTVSFRSR
jgi:spore germination protein YaaH